jgi:hypothetical protein
MSEHDVRTLLRDLAEKPEPASTIDIAGARRAGKRRLWASRAGISVAVAAVAAVAVVVPQTLVASAPARPGAAAAAGSTAASPGGYLNPLVPYAAFGYLPQGYKLGLIPANHDGFTSTVNQLTLTAVQASGPYSIELSVMPKNSCGDSGGVLLNQIPGFAAAHRNGETGCNLTAVGASPATRAPDVDGRPAYWVSASGIALAWQYAPNSWAVLEPFSDTGKFPAAQASAFRSLLPTMAASVKFGQTKPVAFPFKLTRAVPVGWHSISVTYTVTSSGRYLGSELTVSPSYEPGTAGTLDAAVVIAAAKTPAPDGFTCPTVSPASDVKPITSTVHKDGVSWLVLTSPKTTKVNGKSVPVQWTADEACNQQPDNGLYAFAELTVNPAGSAQAPAVANVSFTTIVTRLTLLGTATTTTPLAG